ncbi:MAG: hypothetical protein KatS3mg067_1705 [Thermosynechococcus sp.]|uniref:hypothetical protein n=1 Tax=Thermosynechococcus sp. TaxID=2814275 RepID=UPI00220E239D|nr:hypothetical protein [Thermosynechococcus sp.]BCX12767.1 MAG: hypothetical protein KatS3mg067_1705 [Thermosynechococcus sp.]
MFVRTLNSVLEQHIAGVPGVLAVLIGRTTDGATIAEINYSGNSFESDSLSSLGVYASDLLQANSRVCKLVDAASEADYLLAGSTAVRLVIKAFSETPYFVLFLTKANTNLKLVFERIKAILADGKPLLPPVQDNSSSVAQLLLSYARRYAPDPNFVTLRLSLKTGLHRERLEKGQLNEQEVRILYKAVADLVGMERLPVASP